MSTDGILEIQIPCIDIQWYSRERIGVRMTNPDGLEHGCSCCGHGLLLSHKRGRNVGDFPCKTPMEFCLDMTRKTGKGIVCKSWLISSMDFCHEILLLETSRNHVLFCQGITWRCPVNICFTRCWKQTKEPKNFFGSTDSISNTQNGGARWCKVVHQFVS